MASGVGVGEVAPEGAKKRAFRPDIQGLRMIAVLAVIADHLFHWPAGGFVGVDVFFVISGFLITSLLLREHEKTGAISFAGFYRRRVKRIIPAAMITITVTVLAAYFLFNRSRAGETLWDGVWATFFGANWHFAIADTDYFQADGPVSPLQHFWSLSVEEQFYFVWPWLMLLIFLILGRRGHRAGRVGVLTAIVVISAASFGWAVVETASSPGWAYFSTFSRAWELGVGAIIAVCASSFATIPSWLRPIFGWLGLLGIAVALFFIDDSMPFPGPWAALPVLSTALVVVAGTGGAQRFLWPIMNPVSSYVGDVSYSLYLWHFPVIIYLAAFFDGATYFVVCLLTMAALSALSYHFVENPIRTSQWLEPRRGRRRRRGPRLGSTPRIAYTAAGVLAVCVTVLCVAALAPRPGSVAAIAYEPRVSPTSTSSEPPTAETQLRDELNVALAASSWPEFNPSLDNLAEQRVPQWTENNCINVSDTNRDLCVWGPGQPVGTMAVVGDSIATSWLPAIIGAFPDYEVHNFSLNACPFSFTSVKQRPEDPGAYTKCEEHHAWVTTELAELQPDVVIAADSYHSLNRLTSGADGQAAVDEWQAGFTAAANSLPTTAKKIVLFTPPGGDDLQECYTPISSPADCIAEPKGTWQDLRTAETVGAQQSDMTFLPTDAWFCVAGRCPSFVGTSAMYADSGHLTAAYSSRLAEPVREAIAPVLVAP